MVCDHTTEEEHGLKARQTAKGRRQFAPKKGELDFAYRQDAVARHNALTENDDVRIKQMTELACPSGVLFRELYFECGEVLRCFRGRFRFTLEERAPVEIVAGEAIVVYPDQRVTIEALGDVNLLVYAVFEGRDVATWFYRLGFFNGMHGPASAQIELFRDVKRSLETSDSPDLTMVMRHLSEVLVTFAHDLRTGTNAVVANAVRQIHENLENGIVRLPPLYAQLHLGHTALGRAFKNTGLGSVAEFIRQEQLRLVVSLLRNTQKPIAEIAEEAGFISITHFANFVKKRTGTTARSIRQCGRIAKSIIK